MTWKSCLLGKENKSKYGTEGATVGERTMVASKAVLFSAYLANSLN